MTSFFLIQEDYGREIGTGWVTVEQNRAATFKDFKDAQWDRPLRVLEVNADEGWVSDVSLSFAEDLAATREHLTEGLVAFIHRHHPALARELDRQREAA